MKKTLRDFNLNGKIIVLRCDLNVSIEKGKIIDDTRIKKSLKTINYILDNNAKVIILSHIGRVKKESDKENNTLLPVAKRLSNLLNKEISFIPSTRKQNLRKYIEESDTHIFMLENTRWEDYPDNKESNCDEELSRYWASIGDIFINDAFGTMHRKHASTYGIAKYLDSGVGLLVEEELNKLSILKRPESLVIVLGGSKIMDKLPLINKLITEADYLLLGGAIANTFLSAENHSLGRSLIEEEAVEEAKNLLSKYKNKIILPKDFLVEFEDEIYIRNLEDIKADEMIIDIGQLSTNKYKEKLGNAKTVFFNGPLGIYEKEEARLSSKELIEEAVALNLNVILGGGDMVGLASILGLDDKVYHASTGGGATLEYISSDSLVALDVISSK